MESVTEETQREDVKITLYWRGGKIRMNLMKEELSSLSCFGVLNMVYREEPAVQGSGSTGRREQ